jgi:hypothetical protein
MSETRYPGYDVLDKRDSLSWDGVTRQVIEERLATPAAPRYLDPSAWQILQALCDRVMPQAESPEPIPLAGMLDARLHADARDGYRDARLPPLRQAWCIGLTALDAESFAAYGTPYVALDTQQQDALLVKMHDGELQHPAWQGMPADVFFKDRVLKDVCGAYYSHPHAWSDIGFGGPANPRGYVRMYFDRRDAWEAIEAKPGKGASARKGNRHVR